MFEEFNESVYNSILEHHTEMKNEIKKKSVIIVINCSGLNLTDANCIRKKPK